VGVSFQLPGTPPFRFVDFAAISYRQAARSTAGEVYGITHSASADAVHASDLLPEMAFSQSQLRQLLSNFAAEALFQALGPAISLSAWKSPKTIPASPHK
jgi:hypothetical protein